MVFPWTKRVESRKANIANISRFTRPQHIRDIDSDIVVPDFGDSGIQHAVLQDSQHPDSPVEEPHRDGGVEPVVVEIVAPLEHDMIPAAHDDQDSEHYVQGEENLIRDAAEVGNAQNQHGARQYGSDDTPQPIWFDGLRGITAGPSIRQQQRDAVDDSLNGEDTSDPAVQQEVRGIRPVRDPEQEVVAAREEDDERQKSVPDVSGAVADIRKDFLSFRETPWVRLRATVVTALRMTLRAKKKSMYPACPIVGARLCSQRSG